MSTEFDEFFRVAPSKPAPCDYQRRLAGGDAGRACESQLISPPPGLGKTAAVVLAWIPGENAPLLALDGAPARLPPLDFSLMRLGETDGSPSWTARVLSLRDDADLGLFRLAWLETLLRAADAIGSSRPTSAAQP